jgi:hypothetical protein
MDLPTRPWSHVHFDHIGPLPTSDNGNVYILTIVDRFTRYAEAVATVDITAEETARLLVEKVVCRYGLPDVLGSDRGPVVVALVLNQVFKLLGVKRVKTAAHHPQSNGVVEVFNKTLKSTLRIWAKENQRDWDELLPFAVYAYNTSFHSVLRETPYYLTHGHQPRDITDGIVESDYYRNASIHAYAKSLVDRLHTTHQRVCEMLEKVNEKREQQIDDEKQTSFNVGDKVLLYDPTTPQNVSRKLVRRWLGPYTIIEKHSDITYIIMREEPYNNQKVNIQRLRLYVDDENSISNKNVADEHEHELDIARREVDALSKEIKSLTERQHVIQTLHGDALNKSKNEDENEIPESLATHMLSSSLVNTYRIILPDDDKNLLW